MLLLYLSMLETEEDRRSFETLYYRYRYTMANVAFEILNDHQQAEDAVHNAFLKISRYPKAIADPYSLSARNFVCIAVRHTALNMLRKKKHDHEEPVDNIEELAVVNPEPTEGLITDSFVRAISKLPAKYRDVLQLHVQYEMNDKKIADIADITPAAARKRLQRARELLKEILEKEEGIYVRY